MAITYTPFEELFAPEYQLIYISTGGYIDVGPNTYSIFYTYTMVERQQIFQVCEKYLPWKHTEIQEQWERTMYMYQFIIKSPPPFPYKEYPLGENVMNIELLVRTKDGPAGRLKGDIVSVKQVPHRGWGREETLPNYLIIRVKGVSKEGYKEYEGRHLKVNPDDIESARKRSKCRLNLENLPQNYAEKQPHLILEKITVTDNTILRAYAVWPQK